MTSKLICLLLGLCLIPELEAQCGQCHPAETAAYQLTPMANSVGLPSPASASFTHAASHTQFRVNGLNHEASRNGLSASYPVALRIGSGHVGSSFAIRLDGRWFQSPVSWYAQSASFRISPGFEPERLPDFDREIFPECLLCHASLDGGAPKPIACSRCHGENPNHAAAPTKHPMVNPARLAHREGASVCEQCHLQGAARILHPGNKFSDFTPGRPLEDFWTVFTARTSFRVTSHPEQLALSRCRLADGSPLQCWTCHNPHPTAAKPQPAMDAACLSCHQPHSNGQAQCANCHMPKRGTQDVVHAAYTDHQIQVPSKPVSSDSRLKAWRTPSPTLLPRAELLALVETRPLALSPTPPLDSLLTRFAPMLAQPDPALLEAYGALLLESRQYAQAHSVFGQLTQIQPQTAPAWFRLGLAASALGLPAAANHLQKAIKLDPLYLPATLALAQLQRQQGDLRAYEITLRNYLRHSPLHLAIREALNRLR